MAEVVFRPRAEADVLLQVEYYENKHIGLGGDFYICLQDAVSSIESSPLLSSIVHKNIRRKLIRRFPFAIYFIINPNKTYVLRVLNQSRNPAIIKKLAGI